jgi:hypothetical protein
MDYESTALTAELQAPQALTSGDLIDVAENVATPLTSPDQPRTSVAEKRPTPKSVLSTLRRQRSGSLRPASSRLSKANAGRSTTRSGPQYSRTIDNHLLGCC